MIVATVSSYFIEFDYGLAFLMWNMLDQHTDLNRCLTKQQNYYIVAYLKQSVNATIKQTIQKILIFKV